MKPEKKLIVILISLLIFGSCKKDKEQEIATARQPGSFNLIELKNNQKSTDLKSANKTVSSSFDFGDLKASKEFYFLLTNGGDEPIYDIHLSTNNPSFNVTPSNISSLAGGILLNNEENAGLIPMINIGIIHGTQLNGVGYTHLMPMGLNTSILTITGKTIKNGDTIMISNKFNLSVNAKIMDIKLYENSTEIDLTKPQGSVFPGLGGLGFLRLYSIYDTSVISIKNIGNVSIELHYGGSSNSQSNMITLAQSDSVSLPLNSYFTHFEFDSNGTITDNSRVQLGDDGKGYLVICMDNHRK